MAVPKTPLFVAPQDSDTLFGKAIMSTELVHGLRKLNPNVRDWAQFPDGLWWPGKESGTTTLWLGDPGGKSRKITAFTHGPIPEFTQMSNVNGRAVLERKGWRAIFEKCIRCGAATKLGIETEFRVDLTTGGKDGNCVRCLKNGIRKPATSKDGLCTIHFRARRNLENMLEQQKEQEFLRQKHSMAQ